MDALIGSIYEGSLKMPEKPEEKKDPFRKSSSRDFEEPGEKNVEEIYYDPEDEVVVEDCCPQIFYRKFALCSGDPTSPFWQVWSKHRLLGSRFVWID